MSLKIDFGENDFAPEETPKAAGGTELMQKWLFSRLDPELRDYFQWIASRKRKLEDKPRLFWVHDLAQDPEVEFLKEQKNMLDYEKIIFVSNWQQYQYGFYLGVPYDHGYNMPLILFLNMINPKIKFLVFTSQLHTEGWRYFFQLGE